MSESNGWIGAAQPDGDTLEREFQIDVNGHPVPGVYWTPTGGEADRVVLRPERRPEAVRRRA